ncbi:LuxR C-terminal-related transcriptional regulator [Herbiconiux ginsengi]|uniref:LuxR family transcriptional regulator, maltose regulon positive regulatory protein n=1 Tax=Herbiconiux ginsengi TaxID=381665 RepID=A0A1H3LSP7_9MICO|nr:LuxR C-terminal-related transcriptional regulator [Herbiconiux ginsengi]SDY67452.1 LuxR family transcriptional regulator, maltose regulon positive regulatory protein [Herbiconiux ginsengi]
MSSAHRIAGAPRIPAAAVVRPRLLAMLDTDAALHVVRGPAGSGKTVLLAQWAQSADVRGAWVTIDRPRTTASALVRAIVRALSAVGLPAAVVSSMEAALDVRGAAWELLTDIVNQVGDLRIVIDDADQLDDETLTELLDFVRRTPAVRVAAAVRRSSPLTEPGAALAVDTTSVPPTALAFTAEETATLVARTDSAHDPALLAELTGGLAIAVRAMAVSGEPVTAESANVGPALAAIESYYSLRARALDEHSAQLRRFLLTTSVADVLTAELASDLSGDPRGAELLDLVEADGFGMWTGYDSSRVFTYTTLVRELLQRDLRRTFPGEVDGLLRRVARWSIEHERPFSALSIAVGINDLSLASDAVRHGWLQLLASHGAQTRELFAGTSLLALRRYPLITMLLAVYFNASGLHRARAVQLFGLAIISTRAQRGGASAPERALLRTMESASLRVIGRFSGADEAALDAFDILQHLSPADHDDLDRLEPALWAHVGTTFLYTGRPDEAITCFRAGIAVGDALQRPSALTCLALLAGTLALHGDIRAAQALCREADARVWPPRWKDGYAGSLFRLAEALIALEHGDTDTAEQRIRGLDPHRETIEHWPLIDHVDAMISLLRGQPDVALTRIDESIRTHRKRSATSPQTLQRLGTTRALLQLAGGDSDAATRTLAGAGKQSGGTIVGQARVTLGRGDRIGALRLTLLARQRTLSIRQTAETDVIRLAALLGEGRDAEVQDVGAATLAFLTDHDIAFPLTLIPPADLLAIQEFAARLGREELVPIVTRPGLRSVVPDQLPIPALSEREHVVLRELVRHGSVADIAAALSVSPNTVKSQLRSIYRKLGVTNRDDAITIATTRDLDPR